jgi:hypothetical protein
MKLSKEFTNGFIIFLGIALFFLLIKAIGFGDKAYLRFVNIFFVLYGVNRTVKMNLVEGTKNFVTNGISVFKTSLIGVVLSVVGLIFYSYIMGGDAYIKTIPETFLFAGDPSIATFSICLLFEGIASSVLVAMLLMLYYNDKFKAD